MQRKPRLFSSASSATFAVRPSPLWAVIGGFFVIVYLRWTPLVPDLAAQVARANVVHSGGLSSWWTGWFGGLSLPTYSVLVPPSMAVFGVRLTGLFAVAAGACASTVLVRDTLRPRAGAIALAVSGVADLLNGRVTFTAGVAIAGWALVALRARRPATGAALAVICYFASPLAGLFLGMIFVAIAVVDHSRRRQAVVAAGSLLAVGGVMALMFPGTGTMPFALADAIPAWVCCAGVLIWCPARVVRVSTAIVLLAFPVFLLVPGAVGDNITRLAWVAAAPTVVACAPLPRRLLVAATAALAIWPSTDLVGQLHAANDPSAQAAYYASLRAQLQIERADAGPSVIGQRVEIVDTLNHWGSVNMSSMSLARGWDRQADNAYNPIFYHEGQLTAASYHRWLDDLAVGWVALPAAPLDYASVNEASLIRQAPSYLTLVWSNADWRLYRVVHPAPLVTGAKLQAVNEGGVILRSSAAATVTVKLRWSPYLSVRDPTTGADVPACITNSEGWVKLFVPYAEVIELSSQFDPRARLVTSDSDCAADTAGT